MSKAHNQSVPSKRLSFIITFVAVLIGLLVLFGPFLFGSNLFLFTDIGSDTITVFWPKYMEGARYWSQYGLPGYSFEQGLGMDVFPDHVFRPFQLLLEFVGIDSMPKLFAVVEVLKLLIAAGILWLYAVLNAFRNDTRILFVLLGTFTGYAILGSTWYVFSMTMVQFYLLVYGIDLIFKRNKTWVFILSIFLIGSYQVFYLYQFGLFGIAYILFKYPSIISSFKNELRSVFSLVKGSVVGLLLALPFLWARLKQTTEGPRLTEASLADNLMTDGAFNPDISGHFSSFLLRLLGNNTLGIGDDYSGWLNYLEGPLMYIGSIAIAVSLYYVVKAYKTTKLPLAIALTWLAINFIPFLRRLLWAFQSDYQREVGLMFGLTVAIGFAHGMDRLLNEKLNTKALLIAVGLVFVAIFVGTSTTAGTVENQYVFLYVLFMGFSLLLTMRYINKPAIPLLIALIVVVLGELIVINYPTLNDRPTLHKEDLSKRINYNDYTKEAVATLPAMDTTFYRTHKIFASSPTKHVGLNDALVFGFFGSNSYHSFNSQSYVRLYELFDLADFSNESSTRWASGFVSQPLLMTLVSNRFILAKTNQQVSPFIANTYSLRETVNDINIFENNYQLPLITIFDQQINEADFRQLDLNRRIQSIYDGVILSEGTESSLPYVDLSEKTEQYTVSDYISDIQAIQKRTDVSIESFRPNHITGVLTVNQDGAALISIPHDKYWKLYLDGKPVEMSIMNAGLLGVPNLSQGTYTFKLVYDRDYWNKGKWSFFIGLALFILLLISEEFFRMKKTTTQLDQ